MRHICIVAGLIVMLAVASAAGARAEVPVDPEQAETLRLGTVATLAPLCALRDDAWATDLRRAAIQSATRSHAYDDDSLKAAPGSNVVTNALAWADAEALEDFAESTPDVTCKPLAVSDDLTRADALVAVFRRGRNQW